MDNQNAQPVYFNPNSLSTNSPSSLEGGGSSMPLPAMIFTETSGDQFEWQRQSITLELQRLIESYNDAFCQLHRTISRVDSLRKENILLASDKLKLLFLLQEQERSSASSSTEIPPSSSNVAAKFDGELRHANLVAERNKEPITDGETDTGEGIPNPPRNVLPKSISIRSSEFLEARYLLPRGSEMSSIRGRHPLRLRLPAASSLQNDGEVEVEAYIQGTTKTELCNKWGEMGICPYADRCQFAHGIQELRPVIRHPRYKTQLCRMLSSGGGCPYGHRCHFRHATFPDINDR